MREETWKMIEKQYEKYPSDHSTQVEDIEFDDKFNGLPQSNDYREYVLRYGGGLVGTYPIYGLRLATDMGTIRQKNTAPEITMMFRKEKWLAVENWLVFSIDQSGNPIGLVQDGSIWISDRYGPSVAKLADNFEEFLRKWALRLPDEN